jgi:hypothetical protein
VSLPYPSTWRVPVLAPWDCAIIERGLGKRRMHRLLAEYDGSDYLPFDDPAVPAYLMLHRENRAWVAFLVMGRTQKKYLRHANASLRDLLHSLNRWCEEEWEMVQDGTLQGPALFAEHAATCAVLQAEAVKRGVWLG